MHSGHIFVFLHDIGLYGLNMFYNFSDYGHFTGLVAVNISNVSFCTWKECWSVGVLYL